MIHNTVWFLTLGLMAIIGTIFVYVALNTSNVAPDYTPLKARAYKIRVRYFWALIIAGVIIAIATTTSLPYDTTHGATPEGAIEVDVDGRQWYWTMSRTEFQAGETVVFNVTSSDVNHGLGIYDRNLTLLAQTQAMPGYHNRLRFTFDEPGEYKIMCMEYCGLAHHVMIMRFTVTPKN